MAHRNQGAGVPLRKAAGLPHSGRPSRFSRPDVFTQTPQPYPLTRLATPRRPTPLRRSKLWSAGHSPPYPQGGEGIGKTYAGQGTSLARGCIQTPSLDWAPTIGAPTLSGAARVL